MENGARCDGHDTVCKEVQADGSLIVAVIEAVAAVSNTPTADLPPLYDTVDTEALERLFSSRRDETERPVCVCFEYFGHAVTIRDGRTVTVRPTEDE